MTIILYNGCVIPRQLRLGSFYFTKNDAFLRTLLGISIERITIEIDEYIDLGVGVLTHIALMLLVCEKVS